MRRLLSVLRRAIQDYEMIQSGDVVAVGLSGGKDSLALLAGLAQLRKFYPKPYSLMAITLDMGFENANFSGLAEFCESLEIPFHLLKTQIGPVIFEIRHEKNPCALCAKMRRGALNEAAHEKGANKVALGHHFDDVVETVLLQLFYEGRMGCFSPVTYLSRSDVTVIRPMIYMPEKEVRAFARRNALPVYKNPCPADGSTKREHLKQMLYTLEREIPGVHGHIFGALQRAGLDGWKPVASGRRMPRQGGKKNILDLEEDM